MVNEEDHLRIQVLRSGFQLKKAWTAIDELDTALEEQLDFAFSPTLGYLTACPTNLGTALRASAMMHLPALVIAGQMEKVVRAVNQLGMVVRGPFRRGLGRERQHLPDFQPDDPRRVRGGDHQAAHQRAPVDHRARAQRPREAARGGRRQALRQDRPGLRHPPEQPPAELRRGDEPAFAHPARASTWACFPKPTARSIDRLLIEAQPGPPAVRAEGRVRRRASATSSGPSACAPSLPTVARPDFTFPATGKN